MSNQMIHDHKNKEDAVKQLDRINRDLTVLYEVSNAMRTTLELNHVLYIILTGVTSHTGLGFNRAILFLLNEKDRILEAKMAIGPESGEDAKRIWDYIDKSNQDLDDLIQKESFSQNANRSVLFESLKKLKISIDDNNPSLLSKAFREGTMVHITQDKIGQYAHDVLLQTFKTNEIVIVPLRAKNTVNGIIIADNLFTQKSITEDDLRIFTMLANQAGLAIENSRLYEMVKNKSRMDSITNLWNHGFFQEQLSLEVENARRTKNHLSLLMLDLDNFKTMNDAYGHQNGDLILKEVAAILKESSRENDFVCRYGGEEFSIILPQTNKEHGFIIAERIRQRIEGHHFPKFSSSDHLRVTVSIGLASVPVDAQNKEELISQADKAMYIAKFGGKNQTILAQL